MSKRIRRVLSHAHVGAVILLDRHAEPRTEYNCRGIPPQCGLPLFWMVYDQLDSTSGFAGLKVLILGYFGLRERGLEESAMHAEAWGPAEEGEGGTEAHAVAGGGPGGKGRGVFRLRLHSHPTDAITKPKMENKRALLPIIVEEYYFRIDRLEYNALQEAVCHFEVQFFNASNTLDSMPETTYEAPSIPTLLTLSAASSLLDRLVHANLLGSLLVGIIYGPQVANILPADALTTFINVGYIGLLIIVFEAGLTTDLSLLVANIALSVVTALTGIMFPIGFSFFLLYFGYGYTVLEAFAAGASLSSTSLGTTLALLPTRMRRTRVGAVLMSAALLDDVAGLVIAAIIVQLADNGSTGTVPWYVIVRPILVSLAFAGGVPVLAYAVRAIAPQGLLRRPSFCSPPAQLLLLVAVLSGVVAGANYAGTSELFGAYLAGIFLSILFETAIPTSDSESATSMASPDNVHPTLEAYEVLVAPVQNQLLAPLFFASVGAALPIRSLGRVEGSSAVVWKGIIFSILMVLCKAVVGVWMLIWPDAASGRGWFGARKGPFPRLEDQEEQAQSEKDARKSRWWGAALLGMAMIPRGEIALIVAQLARPLLSPEGEGDSEPFAVVIWAILVTTVGGALGIGFMLGKRGS
ncbi:Sodium/hydrogen exchanger family-domain-containing protein [Schizophyllum commune]